MLNRKTVLGGAVAALLMGTGLAVSGRLATSSAAPRARSGQAPPAGISPTLFHDFAVFRRSTQGQPPLPATLVDHWQDITSHGWSSYELDPSKAQYVSVTLTPHRDIWLVPGGAGACMVSGRYDPVLKHEVYGIMCGSIADVTSGRFVELEPLPTPTVIGVVPDTNAMVSVTTAGGATIQAPVVANVFTSTNGSGFSRYQTRDASGRPQSF